MNGGLAEPLGRQLDAGGFGDWRPLLDAWRSSEAGQAAIAAVEARRTAGAVIYPPDVFRAFRLTPRRSVRVVILGQDPYHGPGQAEGLAFSVPAGQRLPPSLRNIFAELKSDCGIEPPRSGSLVRWAAEEGILLLNASLTVEAARPGWHAQLGWASLTDGAISALAQDAAPKVFLLWGLHAQARAGLIEGAAAAPAGPGGPPSSRGVAGAGSRPAPHCVLRCNHPSPLSARRGDSPFIGCRHFSAASRFLVSAGRGTVDWRT